MYKAILFDFDGVLGKTMEDNYQAWKYAFSKYDIPINKEEYFLLEGLNTRRVAEHFSGEGENKKELEVINQIISLKEKYYTENNKFSFYDGVEFLISKLKNKGYLLGLVSGASYDRLSKTLGKVFINKFEVIITGDNVNNCKPHPEPYLNAAKVLLVSPSDCIVVENAPAGIISAKEAGMFCIAISSTLDKKYLQKADLTIDKIADMYESVITHNFGHSLLQS